MLRLMLARSLSIFVASGLLNALAQPPEPVFHPVTIDPNVQIGYGVAVADVDGDGRPDILLADKTQIAWYRNPSWDRFLMAENLTERDNVAIAARDIDGDGKAEVAIGAEWNPGDTLNSGAVFYLIPPEDPTRRWTPVRLHHEPTVHRMRWIRDAEGQHELVVVPLHGRGNKDGQGAGVRILSYTVPADPNDPWPTRLVDDSLHLTHNLDVIDRGPGIAEDVVVAGREGVFLFQRANNNWTRTQLAGQSTDSSDFAGAGEVRHANQFIATVEPMHGHQLVVYHPPQSTNANSSWRRHVLDDSLIDGHALACGDLLGTGTDQIVVGWRAINRPGVKVGIRLFTPLDTHHSAWRNTFIDDNTMACEDLCLADLDADGRLDVVAAGRATRNLKIYFNRTPAIGSHGNE